VIHGSTLQSDHKARGCAGVSRYARHAVKSWELKFDGVAPAELTSSLGMATIHHHDDKDGLPTGKWTLASSTEDHHPRWADAHAASVLVDLDSGNVIRMQDRLQLVEGTLDATL